MLLCHLFVFSDEASVESFGLFFFFYQVVFLLSFKNSLCIVNSSPLPASFFKGFLLIYGFSSHSLDDAFHRADIFHFNEV